VLVWRDSDVWDYLENFPSRVLTASPEPFHFESAPDPDRVRAVFGAAWEVDDLDTFLAGTGAQAFIVIDDERVIYEAYYNDWQRDPLVTSFSVAKSFVSTLVGIVIEEGIHREPRRPGHAIPAGAGRARRALRTDHDPASAHDVVRSRLPGVPPLVALQQRRPVDDLSSRPARAKP
jgi:hypothetical protein